MVDKKKQSYHFREAKRLKVFDLMQADQAPLQSFKVDTDKVDDKDGTLREKCHIWKTVLKSQSKYPIMQSQKYGRSVR